MFADEDRVDPPISGNEIDTLIGFVDYLRHTIRIKTDGLDADQLNRTLAPSTMTLGGMLKHLALVEDQWFSLVLRGQEDYSPPFAGVDWDADYDWDWHSAANDTPDELRALWTAMVDKSRAITAETLVNGKGLDTLAVRPNREGARVSLRWILNHMVEEYGRHAGHADVIRESIDGSVGE